MLFWITYMQNKDIFYKKNSSSKKYIKTRDLSEWFFSKNVPNAFSFLANNSRIIKGKINRNLVCSRSLSRVFNKADFKIFLNIKLN